VRTVFLFLTTFLLTGKQGTLYTGGACLAEKTPRCAGRDSSFDSPLGFARGFGKTGRARRLSLHDYLWP